MTTVEVDFLDKMDSSILSALNFTFTMCRSNDRDPSWIALRHFLFQYHRSAPTISSDWYDHTKIILYFLYLIRVLHSLIRNLLGNLLLHVMRTNYLLFRSIFFFFYFVATCEWKIFSKEFSVNFKLDRVWLQSSIRIWHL